MKSYCLKYRKDTKNINPRCSKTSNGRTMVLSKCATCGCKKSRFIKNQEANGLLSNLGVKTPLIKIHILGDVLFSTHIKMNEIVNRFLLEEDKFMPEMHLKQAEFTYTTCDHLLKIKNEFKNLKKHEIQAIFTKTNLIRLVFNMI